MADNEQKLTVDEVLDVDDDELAIVLHAGKDFAPSPRVSAALEELAEAMSDAETDEVAGFSFQPELAFNSAFRVPDTSTSAWVKVGCIRTGCSDKVVCGTYNPFMDDLGI